MSGEAAVTGRRRLAPAYLVTCLALAVGVAVIVSAHVASGRGGRYDSWMFTFAVGLVGSGLGALLLWRRPDERLGWVVGVLGLSELAQTFVDSYAAYSTRVHPLPGAAWVFAFDQVPSGLLIALLTVTLLLFPTGRLPSPRWRWLVVVVVVVTVAGMPGRLLAPGRFANLPALTNPIGVHIAPLGTVADATNVLVAPLLIAAAVSVGLRWRRADAVVRDQIKGLVAAAALWPVVIVVLFTTPSSFSDSRWGELLFGLPVMAMLVAVAVAVLRYRLYEIDRLISRTLSYAMVTGLLVGVYVAGVALFTRALAFSSSAGVAASTLAAAAAFHPLRRRVQAGVDRRFNRARYDAARTVSGYSTRLRDSVDYDAVVTDLVSTVGRVVEPATVSLWVCADAG